ncbi:MAG: putative methyltransferase [Gammaproteobacteria bacterium]|jgi:hypothetical protein|nr:putative methyltransferase [Gammaproteobacteria bacterium]
MSNGLHQSLKFKEGWNRGRYGAYHNFDAWRPSMLDAGFIELEYYYRPTGLPREHQPWLAHPRIHTT